MTTHSTNQSPHPTESADQSVQLPALIEKAQTQLAKFLQDGAHVLCPIEVTDPPPRFFPKVVCVQLNPDPNAKEVYVKEYGYGNKPNQLELTKIGLMKLSDTLGVTWDVDRSRRLDTGADPDICSYKAVGYIEDYLGTRKTISGEKHLSLGTIRDALILSKTKMVDGYCRKLEKGDEQGIPFKWKLAIKEGRTEELMASEVRAELIQKRQFLPELAETGAKLRAIRSKGFRTTYTAEELKKPFVDVRMMPIDRPELRYRGEEAYNRMYGPPPEPYTPKPVEPASPSETVIDAQATRVEPREPWPTEYDGGSQMPSSSSSAKPTQRENNLIDWGAADHQQKVEILQHLAKAKDYPLPKNFPGWNAERMTAVYTMLLDLAPLNPDSEQTGLFGKGGQS